MVKKRRRDEWLVIPQSADMFANVPNRWFVIKNNKVADAFSFKVDALNYVKKHKKRRSR